MQFAGLDKPKSMIISFFTSKNMSGSLIFRTLLVFVFLIVIQNKNNFCQAQTQQFNIGIYEEPSQTKQINLLLFPQSDLQPVVFDSMTFTLRWQKAFINQMDIISSDFSISKYGAEVESDTFVYQTFSALTPTTFEQMKLGEIYKLLAIAIETDDSICSASVELCTHDTLKTFISVDNKQSNYSITDSISGINSFLAIDQGPIVVMIENHRTGLCWDLFMSAPEVQQAMLKIGFSN